MYYSYIEHCTVPVELISLFDCVRIFSLHMYNVYIIYKYQCRDSIMCHVQRNSNTMVWLFTTRQHCSKYFMDF